MATNYTIATEVNGTFTVPAGQIVSTTPLKLVGRGAAGYGQAIAENTIKQLSNFAGGTSPSNPLKGQLWFNSSTGNLRFYNMSGTWVDLVKSTDLAAYVTRAEIFGGGSTSTIQPGNGGTGLNTLGTPGQALVVNPSGTGFTFTTIPSINNVMVLNATNVPTANGAFDLGSTAFKYRTIYGTATSAQYADVAERYETTELMEAGDVVELGGEKEIRRSRSSFSTDVFGVISSRPAIRMNEYAGDDTTHPFVALTGRVPVKVIGKVRKGQRLVTSEILGVARAAELNDLPNSFVVIGRALADKNTDDLGTVEVVLGAK